MQIRCQYPIAGSYDMRMSTRPGEWLRARIKHVGLKQAAFADLIGVRQGTVSRWVNGGDIKLGYIWRMSRVLDVTVADLARALDQTKDEAAPERDKRFIAARVEVIDIATKDTGPKLLPRSNPSVPEGGTMPDTTAVGDEDQRVPYDVFSAPFTAGACEALSQAGGHFMRIDVQYVTRRQLRHPDSKVIGLEIVGEDAERYGAFFRDGDTVQVEITHEWRHGDTLAVCTDAGLIFAKAREMSGRSMLEPIDGALPFPLDDRVEIKGKIVGSYRPWSDA